MRFGDAWPVVTLGCAQRRATKRNNSPTDGALEQADAVVMGESTTRFDSMKETITFDTIGSVSLQPSDCAAVNVKP